MPKEVRAAFDALPGALRPCFDRLRTAILAAAAHDPRIGPLEESLKWGQPAYRPQRARTGSTLRLGVARDAPDHCAVFFICNTNLVDRFRARFPELTCMGNRAVLLAPDTPLPEALAHCLHAALSYHLPDGETAS
ncbi:DUF1801 domain-containing protein [Roseobacteraceae bacterium S113]